MEGFQTEFPFTLPTGYLDAEGVLHREGMMRRATAADEIVPLKDPRVQANASYLIIILLSRVITSLGDVAMITPQVIEGLFVEDLNYLQAFYKKINSSENPSGGQPR
jgi:phage FluMu protein gp41